MRDHQSCHNSETAAARYEITSEDINEWTREKLLAFFYSSQDWHRLLGFKIKDAEMKKTMKKVKLRQVESERQVDRKEVA